MSLRAVSLTYCRRPEYLFGNTLVFKTLRHGFPEAEIQVWDNASEATSREAIRKAVEPLSASFHEIQTEIRHADWIEARVREAAQDGVRLVIVDPDVAFWERVDGWLFPPGTLMAGRYIPRMKVYQAITEPRLHTSLLFFPDPAALVAMLDGFDPAVRDFQAFRGALFNENGFVRHVDTCGPLYSILDEKQAFHFTEQYLDAYDHLWVGTSPDYMDRYFEAGVREFVAEAHEEAAKDITSMRGLWRKQEEWFAAANVTLAEPILPAAQKAPLPEWEMYMRWSRENQEAARLMSYFGYATQVADDLVDNDSKKVATLERRSEAMTKLLHTCLVRIPGNAFFREHQWHFTPLFTSCLAIWDASNSWKKAPALETRMFSYVTREATARLIEMIAFIVGGLDWMRQVTREVHAYYHGRYGIETFAAWDAEEA
jgi:hypothetical protein